MRPFTYVRPPDVDASLRAIAERPGARFLGGGTNLVDLMRQDVERPAALIDISGLPLDTVEELPGGGLRIGALVRNSRLAVHPLVRERWPVLSQALLAGASGQVRNMATVGGTLITRANLASALVLRQKFTEAEPESRSYWNACTADAAPAG
ncbi:FAD binding domain-containing protein [Streptomyces sp. NPDC048845]|uniref:FAD binding domain-containing protein n=1 Tax=Streptomyces sp. NPDC048845 TaxID=3155390 RepID=UPI0034294E5E